MEKRIIRRIIILRDKAAAALSKEGERQEKKCKQVTAESGWSEKKIL